MFRKMNVSEIAEIVKISSPSTAVYVGCDSKQRGETCIFATVVIIHHDRSRGANVFVQIEKTKKIPSLKQRIMMETFKAVEIALQIASFIPDREIEIHLDINPSPKHPSNVALKDALSYVSSQGFKPVFKPYSFAAYSVADYVCKKVH